MKRTALTVLVGLTILSIHVHAQQISFTGNPVQLESFFSSVSKQTGFVFFYNATLLSDVAPLSIDLKNVSLDSAMRMVLRNQPFTYSIQGKTIFITPGRPISATSSGEPASGILTIRGRVIDHTGQPLVGATVFGTDLKTYAISRTNGEFQIRIKKGDSLMISCIGYGTTVQKSDSSFMVVVLQNNSNPLEQVIVGGNLFALKKRSDISSVTVIDSKMLQTLPVTDIAEIYRGLVPGTNSFNTGDQPGLPSLTIRGAGSETSLTEIGVYIDGVEWAGGSGYLSTINKETIDRIEVLRGPESSTLYGTGSNGGLVQIYTKKGTTNSNELMATASAGFIESKWVPNAVFQQYYTLDKQVSFKNTSLLAGATYQTNGAWLPGGGEKTGTAHLNLHWDPGTKFSADFSGYYAGTNQGVSKLCVFDTCVHLSDSLLHDYGIYPRKLTNKEAEFRSYFAGLNLLYQANAHWTHHLTIGYSQNGSHQLPVSNIDKNGLVPDNFYQSLNRTTTVRYSNNLHLGNQDKGLAANIMSGAEYKNIFFAAETKGSRPFVDSDDPANTNLGLFAQVNTSFKNVYLTTGLRYDYNKFFVNNHSFNPRIGLTTNFTLSGTMIKPRISWGSGITAPSYSARYGLPSDGFSITAANPAIRPQQQSGFDYGIEVYDRKNRFSGEVVYYDNTIKNMFAEASLPNDANGLYVYQYTNIGEVYNRGWEFSARYNFSARLSLYGSFSIMNSVIGDSTGDYLSSQLAGYAPGYRLKFLPRHTAGFFTTYHFFRLFGKKDNGSVSLNITEVDGVSSYDGVRSSIDEAYGRAPAFNGTLLNQYWVSSGTLFKLGFNIEYHITDALRFFAQGSNILNRNNYELQSFNPTHGANWLFGFKFSSGK